MDKRSGDGFGRAKVKSGPDPPEVADVPIRYPADRGDLVIE